MAVLPEKKRRLDTCFFFSSRPRNVRICGEHGSKCKAVSKARMWVCHLPRPDDVSDLEDELERCNLISSGATSWDLLIAFVYFDVAAVSELVVNELSSKYSCEVAVGDGLASPHRYGLPAAGQGSVVCFGRNGIRAAHAVSRFQELSQAVADTRVNLPLKMALFGKSSAFLQGWQRDSPTSVGKDTTKCPNSDSIAKRLKQYDAKREVEVVVLEG